MAFHLAAGRVEHPARGDGADAGAAGAGLHFRRATTFTAPSFSARSPSSCTGFSRYPSSARLRFAYRYFRYTRVRHHARTEDASPALLIGRAADAEILLRGIESGAVKRLWPVGVLSPSMADRGQSIRNIPVLGGIDDIEDVIRDFARREQADHARGDDAVGVRAGGASRSRADAGAQARADRQPAAVAGERRQPAADRGRGRGPAAAPQRKASTMRASKRW